MKTSDVKKSHHAYRLIDIARESGFSRATVAKVLLGSGGEGVRVSDKTSDHVRQIAKKFNYRPNMVARQLRGKKSHVIGVVIDSCSPQMHFQRLSVMEHEAAKLGYKFMIGQSHNDPGRVISYAEDFADRGVDGAICISHDYPQQDTKIAEKFSQLVKNVVFVGTPDFEQADTCYVNVDVASGVRQAVEYLFLKSRIRVAMLLLTNKSRVMNERYRGYITAMKDHGIAIDESLICEVGADATVSIESIEPYIKDLVVNHKADAFVTVNDRVAAMTIKNLKRMGCKVPEDISVIGFDNIDLAELTEPALTTVDQQCEKLSQSAIRLLVALIEGKPIAQNERRVEIKPKLVIRNSA